MKRKAREDELRGVVKITWKDHLVNALIAVVFGIITIACLFPFYYIFINTVSDNSLVTTGQIRLIPHGIHFANYVKVLSLKELPYASLISLARTVLGTIFTLICAAFPAYCFSRSEYWHKKIFYRFVIITMYFNAGVIPIFLTYKTLGIYDTFWVYILPCCVTPFNLILVKTYIESLPQSLEESAEIDGAGYLTRFIRIVLPLSKPIMATIAVFSAVGQWNSFMDTVLYTKDKNLQTLQYVLYRYLKEANTLAEIARENPDVMAEMDPSTMLSPLTIKYTICIVTILPILLVYPFFQKYFVKGMMIGAVKG
ncbi:MAG: carbohydrate ABC transporter permease [Lachnospiraceae bacterium]|nr:carbohydrate ABC transporter permease [Lachnospiraceae bacterium]